MKNIKNYLLSQKGFAPIVIILIIVGVLILGGGVWFFSKSNKEEKTKQQDNDIVQISAIPEISLDSDLEFEEKCKTLNGAMYVFDHERYTDSEIHCYIPFNEKYKKFHALELFNSAIIIKNRGYIGPKYIGHENYTENDEIINNNGFIVTLGYFEMDAGHLVDKYIKQRGLATPFDTSDKKYLVVKGFNENSHIAEKIQSWINNIICKEKFVKPIDTSKVITDPETKQKIINNQLLITFNENAMFGDIFKKLRALNGEIVGCVLSKDYQVEFPDITFEELRRLRDLFNQDSQIEAVSWNFIVESM